METLRYFLLFTAFSFMLNSYSYAQKTNDSEKDYVFTEDFRIPHTSVKNQYRSGTCWSFSGLSFLEAELMRMGKNEIGF